ncbi:uncharacterized protein LOC110461616 [Mizuhopecten yessoensis]|uniref:Vasopressin V1b receptor n=1 Tax=Mizuhopecten yessoensis TaxID=6573 RepID=A0A210PZY6_MIZYE|nr:uncharacterized protein LOC110461616 [Mizuhopecten yessoensis]OWF42060.1 Vasopressin V1b receptor [Mizuhopecten yessoensis]
MEPDMMQLMYDLNKEEALKRLPVILFLAILCLFGITSNLHVWYIYKYHFKSSTYRVFVLFMAMIDIVCCFVAIPFEFVDELFALAYTDLISCKIFRFLSTCINMASVFMLVIIAFERYGKVCTPDGNVMSETSATFSSTIVLIASVVFTFPAIYVYGRKTIMTTSEVVNYGNSSSNVSVIGYDCTWGNNIEDTLYFRCYHTWILMTIIGCMVVLAVIYSLIWSTLRRNLILTRNYAMCHTRSSSLVPGENNDEATRCKHGAVHPKESERIPNHTIDPTQVNKKDTTISNGKTDGDSDENLEINSEINKQNGETASSISIDVDDNLATLGICNRSQDISNDRKYSVEYYYSAKAQLLREKLRHAETVNERELPVTKVTFSLSLLCIVFCLPYIVCLITYLSNDAYVVAMSTHEHMFYLICFRLYLVNNVIKSIVYGCLDREFRKNLAKLYRSVFDGCKNFVSRNPK